MIGVGYFVYDAIRHQGSPVRSIVCSMNVSEGPSSGDHDRKLRGQLCAWFAAKDCCIPRSLVKTVEDEKLLDLVFMELSSATYDFDENGKRALERKKDQKKRLGFSHDWRTVSCRSPQLACFHGSPSGVGTIPIAMQVEAAGRGRCPRTLTRSARSAGIRGNQY